MRKKIPKTFGVAVVVAIGFVSGIFLGAAFHAFAFNGPSANPPSGYGALGSDSSNNIAVGTSTTVAGTKLLVVGASNDSSTYAAQIESQNGTPLFLFRDDGNFTVSGTITASNLGGSTMSAGNVSSGQFGSNTGGGNYYFPGNVGIGETSISTNIGASGTDEFDTNNYFYATTTATFTNNATSIYISTTTGLPASGYVVYNNAEIMKYSSFTSNGASSTLNGLTRGMWGTTAAAGSANRNVYLVAGAWGFNNQDIPALTITCVGPGTGGGYSNQCNTAVGGAYGWAGSGGGFAVNSNGNDFIALNNSASGGQTGIEWEYNGTNEWRLYGGSSGSNYLTLFQGAGTTNPVWSAQTSGDLTVGSTTDQGQFAVVNPTNTNNFSLVVASTSGDVGVGTVSPAYPLDVNGTARAQSIIISGLANQTCIGTNASGTIVSGTCSGGSGTGTVTSITAGSGLSGGTITASGTISLNVGNANTWTATQAFSGGANFPGSGIWNSSGDVGVGTSSPISPLFLETDGLGATSPATSGITLYNGTAAASGAQQTSPSLTLQSNGWATTGGVSESTAWNIYNLPVQGTTPTTELLFQSSVNGAAPTTRLTLTSGGALTATAGLAATTGAFNAAVTITKTAVATSTTNELIETNTTAATAASTQQNSPALEFSGTAWNSASKVEAMSVQETTIPGTPSSARIDILNQTIDGSANTSTLMSVLSNGNVGIGTTTPIAKLEVNGNLQVDGTITGTYGGTASSGNISAGTFGSNTGGGTYTFPGAVVVDGKLTVGTIDPVYAIGGQNYATYNPAMTGEKEETTGLLDLTCANGVCSKTIDLATLARGSDLWLFSQATDLKDNLNDLVVILTPSFDGNVWYKKDAKSGEITIYGSSPGEVSYRFTAPRFDASQWSNIAPADTSPNFIIPN